MGGIMEGLQAGTGHAYAANVTDYSRLRTPPQALWPPLSVRHRKEMGQISL
jgi:hypothetical protein